MKKQLLSLVALVLVPAVAQADSVRLLPAAEGDLVARRPVAAAAQKAMIPGVQKEAVTFTFPVAADRALVSTPTPHETRSREYFVEIGADELRRGTSLFTTAPNALVRIHPAASEQRKAGVASLTVDPSSLVIRTASGDTFTAGEGMSQLVDADQMKATGVPFSAGTTAFRLAPEVGVGTLTLSAPDLRSDAKYTVHVFDKESDSVLSVKAAAMDFSHDDDLRVTARLVDGAGSFGAERVDGFVTAPNGRAFEVKWTMGRDGQMLASLPLDAIAGAGQGLWELHMVAEGDRDGLHVVRNASTAFAVSLPTAALDGTVNVRRDRGLALELGVDVAGPGRYEVRGVVYGTDASGSLVPFAAAHSAAWLDASGALTLTVAPKLLREAGVRAPFEVRDLRLLDQGRMGILHRQARGIEIR